jgi:hypothetical protein
MCEPENADSTASAIAGWSSTITHVVELARAPLIRPSGDGCWGPAVHLRHGRNRGDPTRSMITVHRLARNPYLGDRANRLIGQKDLSP